MKIPSSPSTSIVLCTFQAEKFLPELLASLRNQTVPANEIVAQDDGSIDETLFLLRKEAAENRQTSVRPFQNPERLGFAKNFASALARASGDILFFCDHDDIWEPQKIEKMTALFTKDPELVLAFSDASLIDETGAPLPGTVMEGSRMWGEGEALPALLRANPVPGMVMAVRASFREKILPLPEDWEHDYWSILLAAAMGKKIAFLPEPLVRYRQHQGQAVGGKKSLLGRLRRGMGQTISRRAQEATRVAALETRIRQSTTSPESLRLVRAKSSWLLQRSQFFRSRALRWAQVLVHLGKGDYHRFEAGFSSALKDWLAPF